MRFVRIQRVSAVAKHVSSMGSKSSAKTEMELAEGKKQSMFAALQNFMRWIPTSRKDIIASEQRLLTLIKTPYQQEQINIGSGPPGSKLRWFRSTSNEPRFINTITFEKNSAAAAETEVVEEEEVPTLVLVHGYGASQGFFFRNFDALATKFRVLAIDQLG
jgi:abhydrolase domain-containing protein 5